MSSGKGSNHCPYSQRRCGFSFIFSLSVGSTRLPTDRHGSIEKLDEIATTGRGHPVDRGDELDHDRGWVELGALRGSASSSLAESFPSPWDFPFCGLPFQALLVPEATLQT